MKTIGNGKITEISTGNIVIKDESISIYLFSEKIGYNKRIGTLVNFRIYTPFDLPEYQGSIILSDVFCSILSVAGLANEYLILSNGLIDKQKKKAIIYSNDLPEYLELGDSMALRVWF